jgi:hypothetical protein
MPEEIPLDGSHQDHIGLETNDFDTHYGKIESPASQNNDSILDAILKTPEDQLIPWEECALPSNGMYYGWADGVVKVRAMGQTAEKVLATQRLAASGQSIEYLFRECVKFPDEFDPIDLLIGDRIYLLYYIRGITYGNMYEFAYTCPNTECSVISTHAYDLNELSNTVIPSKPEMGFEPFKIQLPYLSKVTGSDVYVGIRFLRAGDANEILNKKKSIRNANQARSSKKNPFERKRKQDDLDETITENLEKLIVHVMGSTDQAKIKAFVGKLHAQDTATIREWMKDNTPGIDSSIELECPECAQQFSIELPITETFFRPAKQRRE